MRFRRRRRCPGTPLLPVATEAGLKASGIPLTIPRNGWYTENYTESVAAG